MQGGPRVDDLDGRLAEPTLVERPAQRSLRRLGPVDGNDDPLAAGGLSVAAVVANHRNRCRGVVQAMLAHGAEQQGAVAADAAADHEQVGVLGGF